MAALDELRQAIDQAVREAERKDEFSGFIARDRCLRNAFIPSTPQALLEAAMQCLPLLSGDAGGAVEVPEARLDALLTRLEILAAEDSSLLPKVEILRKKLSLHRAKERRFNRLAAVIGLGAVVLVVWIVVRILGAFR